MFPRAPDFAKPTERSAGVLTPISTTTAGRHLCSERFDASALYSKEKERHLLRHRHGSRLRVSAEASPRPAGRSARDSDLDGNSRYRQNQISRATRRRCTAGSVGNFEGTPRVPPASERYDSISAGDAAFSPGMTGGRTF